MEVGVKLLLMRTLRLEMELSSARRQPVTPPGGGARGAGWGYLSSTGAVMANGSPPPLQTRGAPWDAMLKGHEEG